MALASRTIRIGGDDAITAAPVVKECALPPGKVTPMQVRKPLPLAVLPPAFCAVLARRSIRSFRIAAIRFANALRGSGDIPQYLTKVLRP